MTLKNNAALQVNGAWVFLPPWNLVISRPKGIIASNYEPIELYDAGEAGYLETSNRKHGVEFSISGAARLTTTANGLLLEDAMRSWFWDATTGEAREFALCAWSDTGGAIKRIWKGCTISGDLEVSGRARAFDYSFSCRTPYFAPAATAPDGSLPGLSPYEKYYVGGAGTPAAGVTIVVAKTPSKISNFFPGLASVTAAGNADHRQQRVILSATQAYKIKSLQIVGVGGREYNRTGGSTTVKAALTPYDNLTGASVQASVAHDASYSDPVACDITVPAGAPVYIYLPAAAGHSDVQWMMEVEPQ